MPRCRNHGKRKALPLLEEPVPTIAGTQIENGFLSGHVPVPCYYTRECSFLRPQGVAHQRKNSPTVLRRRRARPARLRRLRGAASASPSTAAAAARPLAAELGRMHAGRACGGGGAARHANFSQLARAARHAGRLSVIERPKSATRVSHRIRPRMSRTQRDSASRAGRAGAGSGSGGLHVQQTAGGAA